MNTVADFCDTHHISAVFESVPSNPNIMEDDAKWAARHFKVNLHRSGADHFFWVYFSIGSALSHPTAADVLSCLAMDAVGIQDAGEGEYEASGDFEAWAEALGYDSDSRAAERAFNLITDQTERLRAWLGADLFEELLYKTEAP